jgi:hypothetical protein
MADIDENGARGATNSGSSATGFGIAEGYAIAC